MIEDAQFAERSKLSFKKRKHIPSVLVNELQMSMMGRSNGGKVQEGFM